MPYNKPLEGIRSARTRATRNRTPIDPASIGADARYTVIRRLHVSLHTVNVAHNKRPATRRTAGNHHRNATQRNYGRPGQWGREYVDRSKFDAPPSTSDSDRHARDAASSIVERQRRTNPPRIPTLVAVSGERPASRASDRGCIGRPGGRQRMSAAPGATDAEDAWGPPRFPRCSRPRAAVEYR